MRNAVLMLIFVLCVQLLAQSEAEEVARELLELTGSAKIGKQVCEQIILMQRQSNPDIPSEFWDKILKEFDTDELIELIIPVYTKHFTVQDMKDVIEFYKTPTGKKLVEKLPVITQEAMAIGQNWGMELGQKIMERINKEGILE